MLGGLEPARPNLTLRDRPLDRAKRIYSEMDFTRISASDNSAGHGVLRGVSLAEFFDRGEEIALFVGGGRGRKNMCFCETNPNYFTHQTWVKSLWLKYICL